MTPSELKYNVLKNNPESHFFDSDAMRFYGDTMRNYGVKLVLVELDDAFNEDGTRTRAKAYELYRKRPVKDGVRRSIFFSPDDFRIIRPRTIFLTSYFVRPADSLQEK